MATGSTGLAALFGVGGRARFFQKLFEGDGVAWAILIGVVALFVVVPFLWRWLRSDRPGSHED